MFKPDNPLMVTLGKLADLIIINILVIICSIPVFTIGASVTAMYYVTVKLVKDEESYVAKDFFKSFKQNFVQATVIWLINIIVVAILAMDALVVIKGYVTLPEPLIIIMAALAIIAMAIMVYVYPVLSRFDNTVKNTVKNAFLLSIANLPFTVLFMVILAIPVAIGFTEIGFKIFPIYLMLGVSGPAYLCSLGWKKIFAKLEPEQESTDSFGENDGKEEKETETE